LPDFPCLAVQAACEVEKKGQYGTEYGIFGHSLRCSGFLSLVDITFQYAVALDACQELQHRRLQLVCRDRDILDRSQARFQELLINKVAQLEAPIHIAIHHGAEPLFRRIYLNHTQRTLIIFEQSTASRHQDINSTLCVIL